MNTNEMIKAMIAISVAVVVFAMVLVPMVQTTLDETKDGEEQTVTIASGYDVGLAAYASETPITIAYVNATPAATVTGNYTTVVTADTVYQMTSTTVTAYSATGKDVWDADATVTIQPTDVVFVNVASDATHGLWSGQYSNLAVENDVTLTVYNDTTLAKEKYNGNAIAITSAPVEDQKGIYGITAVADDGSVIAPLAYNYYEQVPVMDDNTKVIITVVPLMVVIGVLLGAVALFIRRY